MQLPPLSDSFWFDCPASDWYDGLPIANGCLGVMVFGGVRVERLALSETTFWSGEPSLENNPPGAPAIFREVRARLLARDVEAANRLAHGLEGRKLNFGTNLPFGNLRLLFNHGELEERAYRRELDLSQAVACVSYQVGGATYRREIFTSAVHQVLGIQLTSHHSGALTFRVALDGDEQPFSVRPEGNDTLLMDVLARETQHSDGACGVNGHARLLIIPQGGRVEVLGDQFTVVGADSAVILLAAGTTYAGQDPREICRERIAAAAAMSFDRLRSDHIAEHQRFYNRVALDLGPNKHLDWPIDRRIAAAREGADDSHLCALLFQFGRYLLLSSSRPESPLPANLLGAWNDNKACRIGWTCDYHLDINTQMNYWIAEVAGLGDCHLPLFRWLENTLVPSGRRTARSLYDLPGWVAHVFSNAWGFSAWGWSTEWGVFPTGGVWAATHLWDHYAFTGDRDFLAKQAYPILKEAAEFCLAYLIRDPQTGYQVSGPANSPENAFAHDGQFYPVALGPTVDRVLIAELFAQCISAGEILASDAEFRSSLREASAQLPPYQIGRNGQIQEWLEDYEEAIPGHRHTSHLLGLFPFAQITPNATPELARAARISLERRISAPDYEEGAWARNNITLFYTRLGDGQAAYASLTTLFRKESGISLMIGPRLAPAGAYEMDYNTGASAGIAEMLLQSHSGCIHLLPALPPVWSHGGFYGLCARGGFEVDVEWADARLQSATIASRLGGPCRVKSSTPLKVTCGGVPVPVSSSTFGEIEFATRIGEEYALLTQ